MPHLWPPPPPPKLHSPPPLVSPPREFSIAQPPAPHQKPQQHSNLSAVRSKQQLEAEGQVKGSTKSKLSPPCASGKANDVHTEECGVWCKPEAQPEHCGWCKCSACGPCKQSEEAPPVAESPPRTNREIMPCVECLPSCEAARGIHPKRGKLQSVHDFRLLRAWKSLLLSCKVSIFVSL